MVYYPLPSPIIECLILAIVLSIFLLHRARHDNRPAGEESAEA